MDAFTLQAQMNANWSASKTVKTLKGTFADNPLLALNYSYGTGANKIAKYFRDRNVVLAASGTQSYDLSGALTDDFGDAVVFSLVRLMVIKNISDQLGTPTTAVLQVGGDTNAFFNWVADKTDKIQLRAGGGLILMASDATGYPVTNATADILKFTNADGVNQCQFDVHIFGE